MTRSGPVLALAPGTPGTGANTGHAGRRIPPEPLCQSHCTSSSPTSASSPGCTHAGYDAWLGHVWHAAACTRPIRLRGDIRHIDPATGELLRTIPTIGMPDGVIYKPCGNRRATACPGCAETYRRDAYQLIRAGLVGGKGITPTVATHPAVFATFTAPSFGPVHARPVRQHTCADKTRCTCQPAALPRPPRRRHVRARPPRRLLHPAPPRRSPARPAAVPGLLRLPRPRGVEQPRRRTMAAHQASHRTPPQPVAATAASRGLRYRCDGPRRARQGRRIPGPRRRPLPRPAPPRRLRPRRPGPAPAPATRHHHRRPGRRHPVGRRRHQLPHPARTPPSPAAGPSPGAPRSTSAPSP